MTLLRQKVYSILLRELSDNQIVVAATALPTVESAASGINTIALGPTPASIQPETQRVLGDPNAPVTIVEFSDYQCPFCRRHFQETFPLLKENYIDTGRISYVFKDFPIASLHPLAYRLHEASLCVIDDAGTDGYWQAHDLFFIKAERFQVDSLDAMDVAILAEFENANLPDISECLQSNQNDEMYWTVHELLFSRQEEWAQVSVPNHVAILKTFASEAGLPQDEFDACLDSGRHYDAVNAELAEGTALGVRGTPAFFINGQPLSGAQPFPIFQQVIEQLLAAN